METVAKSYHEFKKNQPSTRIRTEEVQGSDCQQQTKLNSEEAEFRNGRVRQIQNKAMTEIRANLKALQEETDKNLSDHEL